MPGNRPTTRRRPVAAPTSKLTILGSILIAVAISSAAITSVYMLVDQRLQAMEAASAQLDGRITSARELLEQDIVRARADLSAQLDASQAGLLDRINETHQSLEAALAGKATPEQVAHALANGTSDLLAADEIDNRITAAVSSQAETVALAFDETRRAVVAAHTAASTNATGIESLRSDFDTTRDAMLASLADKAEVAELSAKLEAAGKQLAMATERLATLQEEQAADFEARMDYLLASVAAMEGRLESAPTADEIARLIEGRTASLVDLAAFRASMRQVHATMEGFVPRGQLESAQEEIASLRQELALVNQALEAQMVARISEATTNLVGRDLLELTVSDAVSALQQQLTAASTTDTFGPLQSSHSVDAVEVLQPTDGPGIASHAVRGIVHASLRQAASRWRELVHYGTHELK